MNDPATYEPTPFAIDEEIGRRVYGLKWFDLGTHGPVHHYIIADPTTMAAHVKQLDGQPLVFIEGLEIVDVLGIAAALICNHLHRPSLSAEASIALIRFISREYGLRVATTSTECESVPADKRHTVSLHLPGSGTAPIAIHSDRTFERAATRAALKVMDWVEAKKIREQTTP